MLSSRGSAQQDKSRSELTNRDVPCPEIRGSGIEDPGISSVESSDRSSDLSLGRFDRPLTVFRFSLSDHGASVRGESNEYEQLFSSVFRKYFRNGIEDMRCSGSYSTRRTTSLLMFSHVERRQHGLEALSREKVGKFADIRCRSTPLRSILALARNEMVFLM